MTLSIHESCLAKALVRKYSLYRQNMMWLTSTVTHFLTEVSQDTSPNFSKGWCVRELTPRRQGLISHTCGAGVFSDTVNHSESVINHFTVK